MRRRLTIGLCLLLVAAYLLTGVTQVRPGERAVVRRFGRVVDTPSPGLWIGLPWGMDRVDRVPVDLVRRVVVGFQPGEDQVAPQPGQLLTGDHNLVNARVVIDYAVEDTQVVEFVEQADRTDALVSRVTEAALAEWAAGNKIDDILIHGKAVLPGLLVQQTQERLEPYRLGIQVRDASVAYLYPPDEVKDAFDEVTRAQTSISTREHEARQVAARLRREAETEKYRRDQLTAAYVQEQLRLAQAEAATFDKRREQYQRLRQQNPDFLTGLWWEEMGKLFERMKESGRLDVLDHHLGADGLDISQFPALPKKK